MIRTKGRSCRGKVRHDTRDAAHDALRHMVRRTGAHPGRVGAYQCRHCHGWHVGHLPRYRGQR